MYYGKSRSSRSQCVALKMLTEMYCRVNNKYANKLGIKLRTNSVNPSSRLRLVRFIRNKPYQNVIHLILVRVDFSISPR